MSAIFLLICILLPQLNDLNICSPSIQVMFCILTCSRQEEKASCLQWTWQITEQVCNRGSWACSITLTDMSTPSTATFTGGCRHCLVQVHLKKNEYCILLFFSNIPVFLWKDSEHKNNTSYSCTAISPMNSDCVFSRTWTNAFVMTPLLSYNEFQHFNREKLSHNITV